MLSLSEQFPFRVDDFINANQLILCLERQQSFASHFSFSYLLLRNIRSILIANKTKQGHKKRVSVISANHDYNHFKSVFKKHNIDADNLIRDGQLEIVCIRFDNPIEEHSKCKYMSWEQLQSWMNSFQSFKESSSPINHTISMNNTNNSANNLIEIELMIDDLEMLELLSPSNSACRSFLSNCIASMYQPYNTDSNDHIPVSSEVIPTSIPASEVLKIRNICIFGRQAMDSEPDMRPMSLNLAADSTLIDQSSAGWTHFNGVSRLDESGQPILSEYLLYRADVVVTVSPLETGYASDIHGRIRTSIAHKNRNQGKRQQNLLFKATDSSVVCSVVGEGK